MGETLRKMTRAGLGVWERGMRDGDGKRVVARLGGVASSSEFCWEGARLFLRGLSVRKRGKKERDGPHQLKRGSGLN